MIFRSHHQTLITFLLKIRERERVRYAKNTWMTWWRISWRFRGCAWTVRGVPQSKSPRGGVLSWERAKERCGEGLLRFGKKKERAVGLSPRDLGPTCARHARTVCDAPADNLRGARTVRCPGADGPFYAPEPLVPPQSPSNCADGPRRTGGQSARYRQTVQPTGRIVRPAPFFISAWYIPR
jgi:hypothetical protein